MMRKDGIYDDKDGDDVCYVFLSLDEYGLSRLPAHRLFVPSLYHKYHVFNCFPSVSVC